MNKSTTALILEQMHRKCPRSNDPGASLDTELARIYKNPFVEIAHFFWIFGSDSETPKFPQKGAAPYK